MTVVWIILNAAGVILILSHLGEREHRYKNPDIFWNVEEWEFALILMIIIGVCLNVLMWLIY